MRIIDPLQRLRAFNIASQGFRSPACRRAYVTDRQHTHSAASSCAESRQQIRKLTVVKRLKVLRKTRPHQILDRPAPAHGGPNVFI